MRNETKYTKMRNETKYPKMRDATKYTKIQNESENILKSNKNNTNGIDK